MHKMEKSVLATALVAMTVIFSGVASANEATDKQAIINAYQDIDAAFGRKDIDRFFSYLAPEYIRIGPEGNLITLKLQRQQKQDFLKRVRKIKVHDEIKQIQISEQTATVIGVGNYTGTITDLQNPQVTKPFSMELIYQDIWKHTIYGWKIVRTHTLSHTIWIEEEIDDGSSIVVMLKNKIQIVVLKYSYKCKCINM